MILIIYCNICNNFLSNNFFYLKKIRLKYLNRIKKEKIKIII